MVARAQSAKNSVHVHKFFQAWCAFQTISYTFQVGSSEKKTGTSCLLTESQLFHLLLSTSPAVNIFAGSKTETYGQDIEKNETKTVPENLGHMFSRTEAIQGCVSCRCLISTCINHHSSIPKGIVNFFLFSSKNLICS